MEVVEVAEQPVGTRAGPAEVVVEHRLGRRRRVLPVAVGRRAQRPDVVVALLGQHGAGGGDVVPTLLPRWETSSPSSGVRGRLDEVADVLEEMDGPGVVGGDEGMGGGVTERERCMVAMWMVGRACQKDEVVVGVARGTATGWGRLAVAVDEEAVALELGTMCCCRSGALETDLARFFSLSLSRSLSRRSRLRARRSSSISARSTAS